MKDVGLWDDEARALVRYLQTLRKDEEQRSGREIVIRPRSVSGPTAVDGRVEKEESDETVSLGTATCRVRLDDHTGPRAALEDSIHGLSSHLPPPS